MRAEPERIQPPTILVGGLFLLVLLLLPAMASGADGGGGAPDASPTSTARPTAAAATAAPATASPVPPAPPTAAPATATPGPLEWDLTFEGDCRIEPGALKAGLERTLLSGENRARLTVRASGLVELAALTGGVRVTLRPEGVRETFELELQAGQRLSCWVAREVRAREERGRIIVVVFCSSWLFGLRAGGAGQAGLAWTAGSRTGRLPEGVWMRSERRQGGLELVAEEAPEPEAAPAASPVAAPPPPSPTREAERARRLEEIRRENERLAEAMRALRRGEEPRAAAAEAPVDLGLPPVLPTHETLAPRVPDAALLLPVLSDWETLPPQEVQPFRPPPASP